MVQTVELPSLPASVAPFSGDWHSADIAAALKKGGHSLAGLSIDYHQTAAEKALKQPWPAVEMMRRPSTQRRR
jgi:lambda repressor-like predicted transcriptional regulator